MMKFRGKILIVDDEPRSMKVLERNLRKNMEGLLLFKATSGIEALGILQEEDIDVLITDQMMPGMSGLELIAHAKHYRPYLQCIVFTENGELKTAGKAIRHGGIDYLEKPYRHDKILPALSRALQKNKQQRNLLRELQEGKKSRKILDTIQVGVLLIDAVRHVIVDANLMACKMISTEREEIIGQVCHRFICPEEKGECPIIDLGKKIDNAECFLLTANGKKLSVLKSVTHVMLDGKEYLLECFMNINEQKHMKEENVRQLALMNNVLATLTHPFYVIDANDYTVKLSNSATNFSDSSENKLTCYALIYNRNTPCTGDEHPCPMEQIKKTREPLTLEHIHHTPDGGARYFEVHAFPFFDSNGDITEIIVYRLDISAWKKAQADLAANRAAFHAIVERSQDGIIIVDKEGVVQFINPAAASFFDKKQEEMLRQQFGFPVTAGESTEIQVFSDKQARFLEMRVAETEWNGEHAYIASLRDITERKKMEEQIRHMATHDTLTGLPNRFLVFDRLERAISLAHRNQQQLAVLFIDLDNFKQINDTLGHKAGDTILKEVAKRLLATVRSSDTVARIGGDEFMVLLNDIKMSDNASHVALKIIDFLQAPIDVEGHKCQVGSSIGIALFPDDGKDCETLMKNADAAMYRVKEKGKNNYAFYGKGGKNLLFGKQGRKDN